MKLRLVILLTLLTACFGGSNLSPTGDITGVTAGTGLSGGALVGNATLTLNMTAQSCSAGQHISAATATGVFTCTADSGGGGITNSASNNYYAKSNGTNLINGTIKDDGTNVTFNTVAGGSTVSFSVASATGNTNVYGTFDSAGAITENSVRVFSVAGNGLTSSGATVDVVCTTNSLTCNANSVELASRDFGDLTVGSTGTTMTIDNDVVTYAKMQNVSATSRLLCRITAGAGDMEECTGTQATSLLTQASTAATTQGVVPGSNGAGATAYLNGNLGWSVPPDLGAPSRISASLSAHQDDWAPAGFTSTTTVIDLTSVSVGPFQIKGLSSSGSTAGRMVTILNNGGNTFEIVNEAGSSSAANRIKTTGSFTGDYGNYGAVTLVWNGTNWNEVARESRYSAELYSLGGLSVVGQSDLLGAVLTYGNTTIGDASGDTLSVNATPTFNANVTIATGQFLDVKTRTKTQLLTGSGTPSTPTSCGGSPAIDADSTNLAGSFTTGSATTACTITFTTTWPVRPWCMVTKSDGSVLAPTNITDGTSTLVLAGLAASTTYRYWCTGGD